MKWNMAINSVSFDQSLSLCTTDIMDPMVTISRYKSMVGHGKIAAEFAKVAKETYLVYSGTISGFENVAE